MQLFTGVCSAKLLSALLNAAFRSPTLLVGSIDAICQLSLSAAAHIATTALFSVAGPTVLNSLTDGLRDPTCSFDSFRRDLEKFSRSVRLHSVIEAWRLRATEIC